MFNDQDNRYRYHQLINSFLDRPRLTEKEESALWKRVKQNDPKARREMVNAYLWVAALVVNGYNLSAIDSLEAIQEGTLGLIRALDKFDPDRGVKFVTYATYWVRAFIITMIEKNVAAHRSPGCSQQVISKVRQVEIHTWRLKGRDPTIKELVEATSCREESVVRALLGEQPLVSLSAPISIGEDGDTWQFGDQLPDADSPQADEMLERQQLCEAVRAAKARLRQRAAGQKFGERNLQASLEWLEEGATLSQIGQRHGITRERVRQLAKRVAELLRKELTNLNAA
jgi:RNA polymerase sigma factor (sigma-70 family)